MKRVIVLGIFLTILSTHALAETMYVSDVMKVTLRTGPGIDHKILALIKSGQEVEVLEPNDQWTRVRLGDKKEGWILTRFLTTTKPSVLILDKLKRTKKKRNQSQ